MSLSEPGSDSARAAARIERLLACFGRALGHEMLNHMMAIHGLVRVLEMEEQPRLSAEGAEYLSRLGQAVQRTQALVKALAELARMDRELQAVEAIRLAEAAQEAAAEARQLFPGQPFHYHFPETDLVVRLARKPLRLVLLHLLRNAVQAADPQRASPVEIGARPADQFIDLWVADHGRGLSAEEQQRLFEPFAGRLPSASGVGLGLVLVRHVVEGWGGEIQVQSSPGQGSVFTIRLPEALTARLP